MVAAPATLIGQAFLGAVLSSVSSVIQKALTPEPDPASFSDLGREQGLTTTVRASVAESRVVWGERQLGGIMVFAEVSGTDNKFLHMVIALCEGRIEAIDEIWFDDEPLGDRKANGDVTSGKFKNFARVNVHLGDNDQAADEDLVSAVDAWTTDHRLRGVAYLYVRLLYDAEVYANGIPNVAAVVRGRRLWDPRRATKAITSSSVADPTTLTITGHGFAVGDRIFVTGHTGSTPPIAGEYQVLGVTDIDNITIDVDVTTGGTGGAASKMVYTTNAALAALDYLIARFGLKADPDSEIDTAAAIAAANICDEEVALPIATPTLEVSVGPGPAAMAFIASLDTMTSSILSTQNTLITSMQNALGNHERGGFEDHNTEAFNATLDTLSTDATTADTNFTSLSEILIKLEVGTSDNADEYRKQRKECDRLQNEYSIISTDFNKTKAAAGQQRQKEGALNMIEAVKDIKAGSGPPPGVGGTDKSADDTDDVKAALDTLAADALTDNLFTQAVTDEMIDRLHPEDHVELSTTDTLPAPFAPATPYFVVRVNDTEFKLTASLVDARAGIVIDITDDGAGVHTLTRKTQPRYTNNGILVLDQRPIDVAEAIIAKPLAGALVYAQGKYVLFAGAYTGPATITLDESDLRGPIGVAPRPGKEGRHNGIKGTFADRDSLWQNTDFPTVSNPTFVVEDGGEELWNDIEYIYATDSLRVQRLARAHLELHRRGSRTIEFPGKLTTLRVGVMETVDVTIDRLKLVAAEHLVVGFKIGNDGAPNLLLQATDPAIWAWDPDVDGVVPDVTPPIKTPGEQPEPPSDLVITSGSADLFVAGDGTVHSRIRAVWAAAPDVSVTSYLVQTKKTAEATYDSVGPVTADQTETFISPVEDGIAYDVRIRSHNDAGASSEYVTASGHVVVGKLAPPADVVGFTVQQIGNLATYSWNEVGDADLKGYKIVFGSPADFDFDSANVITFATKGTLKTDSRLPPGAHRVAIKAVDTSGNESVNATTFDITIANVNEVIATAAVSPRWQDVAISGGNINSFNNFIDMASTDGDSTDSEVMEQYLVNSVAEMIVKAPATDLGFVAPDVRVHVEIEAGLGPDEAGIADPLLEISARDTLPDALLKEDGSFLLLEDGGEMLIEDGGFVPFSGVGMFTARYIQVRARILAATGVAFLKRLVVTVDKTTRTEHVENVSIAAGWQTVTFVEQFHKIPNVQVTADGAGAHAERRNVTTADFETRVLDNADAEISGTIDYTAIGV